MELDPDHVITCSGSLSILLALRPIFKGPPGGIGKGEQLKVQCRYTNRILIFSIQFRTVQGLITVSTHNFCCWGMSSLERGHREGAVIKFCTCPFMKGFFWYLLCTKRSNPISPPLLSVLLLAKVKAVQLPDLFLATDDGID